MDHHHHLYEGDPNNYYQQQQQQHQLTVHPSQLLLHHNHRQQQKYSSGQYRRETGAITTQHSQQQQEQQQQQRSRLQHHHYLNQQQEGKRSVAYATSTSQYERRHFQTQTQQHHHRLSYHQQQFQTQSHQHHHYMQQQQQHPDRDQQQQQEQSVPLNYSHHQPKLYPYPQQHYTTQARNHSHPRTASSVVYTTNGTSNSPQRQPITTTSYHQQQQQQQQLVMIVQQQQQPQFGQPTVGHLSADPASRQQSLPQSIPGAALSTDPHPPPPPPYGQSTAGRDQTQHHHHHQHQPHHYGQPTMARLSPPKYVQPRVARLPADRPLIKLSVALIDTYKRINTVYYDRKKKAKPSSSNPSNSIPNSNTTINNNGWDDENYDYIVTRGEKFFDRYVIQERIGKGSFGQVVRATDTRTHQDVAIKIIKSKKPFLLQAQTEIELLTRLNEKDPEDQHNIVRLLTHFMYRNHQCLVFEMLSLNLYELLKNTRFNGVSLSLIRKFAKQILKALMFLARPDVDIIHCDLKPENILLRHPEQSGVKVIDFGSSCHSRKRMYTYIQSRFYRSPEVMLGLPYSVTIDMWSLGCILVEMHTGEPLFSGADQFDQMRKIVKHLGMVPSHLVEAAGEQQRNKFFEKIRNEKGEVFWTIKQVDPSSSASSPPTTPATMSIPSENPLASLTEAVKGEASRKKRLPAGETGNTPRNYQLFVDFVYRMLAYDAADRILPEDALMHPFIQSGETQPVSSSLSTAGKE